ncbi:hypothetical protein PWG71_21425 [Nocardiopsis sp. N85]|uniref:hypothetical protein n=1 Tax=Nocardiopsis sp. N85 TaxID=3029400 RepID=UPI00237F0E95|nr:hypothetical protein [Nocardiopsis sp. N85]MDE3723959.1 hypothetical protein [Nocardiopsis sp. N85]
MSLAEFEAYERERRLRRQRIRRAVSWAPLGVAALMLAVGGLSVWSASSGHDADRAEVAALVDEREIEAEEAREELHTAWSDVLGRSSVVRVERLENDGEAMHALLRETVMEGAAVPAALVATDDGEPPALFEDLARDGVPGLDGASQARLGPFEPVLVDITGVTYSYFAFVEVHDADVEADPVATLSVEWSTDSGGAITGIDAHWTERVPERS